MVKIVTEDAAANVGRRFELPDYNVRPSEVIDQSNAAAEVPTRVLESAFTLASKVYEQKQREQEAANRTIKVSQEGANASRYSDGVIEDMKKNNVPLDQYIPTYQQKMGSYLAQKSEDYSSDPTLQAEVYAHINRVSLVGEHDTHTYVQQKNKESNVASIQDQYDYLLNSIPNQETEIAREQRYNQIDSMLDGAVKADYIPAPTAEQMKRKARSEGTAAIVSEYIGSGDLKSATDYLDARKEDLSPGSQAIMANRIINEQDRLERRAEADQKRQEAYQEKVIKLGRDDPGEAAGLMGVDTSRPDLMYDATKTMPGGAAVVSKNQAKADATELLNSKSPTELIQNINAKNQQYGDYKGIYWDNLEKYGKLPAQIRLAKELDPRVDYQVMDSILQSAQDPKATNKLFTEKFPTTKDKDLTQTIMNSSQNYINFRGQLGNDSSQKEYIDTTKLAVKNLMNQYGYTDDVAVQKVISTFQDKYGWAHPSDGKTAVPVPSDMEATLVEKSLDGIKNSLDKNNAMLPENPALKDVKVWNWTLEAKTDRALRDAYWVVDPDNSQGMKYNLVTGVEKIPIFNKETRKPISVLATDANILAAKGKIPSPSPENKQNAFFRIID